MKIGLVALALLWAAATAGAQPSRVADTLHNLSVSGPGAVRAASEQQICIFCHTPHNSQPIAPLWNRYASVSAYTVYSSNALDALPDQPTGSSKLCLSCHDGTIALGTVASRSGQIAMLSGITTIPAGSGNLGTDLSDDHPISFRYDHQLVQQDPNIKPPEQLPQTVKLDANLELQCTSCHDAHSNVYGDFLVMSNDNSQLCNTCHQGGNTQVAGHMQCNGCHIVHTAPSGPYLLVGATVREACLSCHDQTGGPTAQAPNIAQDISKLSIHDTNSSVDIVNPLPDNVGCTDCHHRHTMDSGTASAPMLRANFGKIAGISTAGSSVDPANNEYEVCFKCHGDQPATQPWISRMIVQNNTRLEFGPSAISFHPVTTTGQNSDVPSLKPGWTTSSMVYCTDCHSSDSGTNAGGSGPDGVHGSNYHPLLIARYETADGTQESAAAYALCYRCHQRTSILNNDSFKRHKKHIENEDTPCSVCHDAHGIASSQGTTTHNSHLINFDTSAVQPSQKNGRLEFVDQGRFRGECSLLCHGKDHDAKDYKP